MTDRAIFEATAWSTSSSRLAALGRRVIGKRGSEFARSKARVDRRKPERYATFPYDEIAKRILAGLDN